MIVDSSVIVAILKAEPNWQALTEVLNQHRARMSVANWFESTLVVDRSGPTSRHALDGLVRDSRIELVPVSISQATIAREAKDRYGKGSGSPARLNLGDCFAYALAKESGEPLLYVGADFDHTDVTSTLG